MAGTKVIWSCGYGAVLKRGERGTISHSGFVENKEK